VNIHCNEELFDRFPSATIHGMVVELVNCVTMTDANDWKRRAAEAVSQSGVSIELLSEHPVMRDWRSSYKAFGLKPSKYRSSIEQLYRRALKGNLIETAIPLVNIYSYISIISMAPMGGYDLIEIKGDVEVRLTIEGEEFSGLGGTEPIKTQAGVVAYSDAQGIICWGWNYRDCDRTCLRDKTTKAIFFADSCSESNRKMAETALDLLEWFFRDKSCSISSRFTLRHGSATVSISAPNQALN